MNLDKSGEEILNLSRLSMSIFDCDILRHAISKMFKCKHCKCSNLRFYKSTFTAGIVEHIYIICEGCHSGTDFYNSTQTHSVKKHFANNILQLLGGRIIGVGKSGLDLLNSILGIPKTLGKRAFYEIQSYVSEVATKVARDSCKRACNELRRKFDVPENTMLEVEVSYDGAYQRRGGSKGGGHSRYCFASAISTESGKVLDFEIACNSCRQCTEKQQALRNGRVTRDQYVEWFSKHQKNCQADEYGDINSVGVKTSTRNL